MAGAVDRRSPSNALPIPAVASSWRLAGQRNVDNRNTFVYTIVIRRGPRTREMKYDFMAPKVRDAMAKENSDFELLTPSGFEWDDVKSDANLAKHGIAFDDASEVFYGPIIIRKSTRNDEERWLAIGISHDRLMSVIFTRRNELIRIISARSPRPDEKRAYRNAKMG